MVEKMKDRPKQSRDPNSAVAPKAPTKPAPNPPPRDCAEAPAPNPNGEQHGDGNTN